MNEPDRPNAVPPEYEQFMRPEATPQAPGAGQVARHDTVSDTALSDFSDLFRDPPPPQNPPHTQSPPSSRASVQHGSTPDPHAVTAPTPRPDPGATAVLPPPTPPGRVPPPPVRLDPPGGPVRPPRSGRSRAKRILLYVLVALLVYVVALVGFFALNVNKINAMPADQIADTAGSNYLLVGSDGREELTKQQQRQLHTGSTDGQRTDTIMLLHVPNLGTPTLISIPRDSWVPIPGNGEGKINSAYALGGPQLLIQTVENTTGVHIDHYVEIGMLGVADIADSLGGVTMCPAANYDDENSGLDVKKGCQVMDGPTALAYVRMRYADPKGDIGRAERQQEYVKAVAAKTANPLTFLNPFKVFSVDRAAASSLTVDDGTGVVADGRMAFAMALISAGLGEQTAVPIESDSYWVNGQQAVKWDTPRALKLFESIGGG